MPDKYIRRGSALDPGTSNKPGANTIRVNSSDDTLKFGTGASGTTEVTAVTTTQTQTLTNKTLTAPVLGGTVTGTYTLAGVPTVGTLASNFSPATVSAGYSTDTLLAGSNISMPSGGFVAGARYVCVFDMVKTAAGTAQFTITLRIGTAGSIADTAILTFAFAAGTAAVDTGTFEVFAHFRTVGATTTAVMVGTAYCTHALAATGLVSTGASGAGQITQVSSGFDSTVAATIISLSVNGGASFSGTNTIVETELRSF